MGGSQKSRVQVGGGQGAAGGQGVGDGVGGGGGIVHAAAAVLPLNSHIFFLEGNNEKRLH